MYPAPGLASPLVGFAGIDNTGLAGLELRYDDLLAGQPGRLWLERAPGGLTINAAPREVQPATAGTDLVLTLDRQVQWHTEEVLDMVLREEVQIGLGRPIRHPEIELVPLFEDEMIFVVSARHQFASRGRVRMDELADERLILFDRTSSYHELTSALFRQAGVVPESVMELDNVEAAKKMVQQGLGVALLPRMALATELRSRSLRPVRLVGAPTVRRPLVALRRRDAGPPIGPVAGFLEVLEEVRAAQGR